MLFQHRKKECGIGVSLEWFNYEPYLTASSEEEQDVESNCTQIPGGSTVNNFEPHAGVLQVSSEWFDYTKPYLIATSKV